MERSEIQKIVSEYDPEKITIGVLGSHSAEEVGVSAKTFGFPTVVVCQKGREDLYAKYNRHLFDHVILLDRFSDMIREDIQEKMLKLNTIFIPNRSFSVYVGYDNIEEEFKIPIYGNRFLLRAEERNAPRNQYWLLEKAGIKIPKKFDRPEDIDRLVIVKVQQKKKPLERAFFYASSPEDYYRKAEELIKKDVIDEEALKKARIEEYVLGQKFNANFQGWAIKDYFGDFDFVGFDDRKQTNLHGVLSLPARDQLTLDVPIKNEEIGHYGLTMRESQKPMVYRAAEKFRRICEKEYPPGMIGLFALQGAVAYDADDPEQKRLAFYVFDVSPRIPGSPCVGPTSPEMRRLTLKYQRVARKYGVGRIETPLDLPMLEIRYAAENGRLGEIVT
ncbi:MAG TPA: formate--phosphoribosylaminoimidazolecarboxamide ligase family protein [Candidatus Bathyarchaeota archaeon]|nr:formate--phosphoribosylaminoimidazolecarboxamide ligase family protein [Candidatus Bathyarchaeota archaeon]